MLNNSWEIYETGTFNVDVNDKLKLVTIGGSLMKNKTTDKLECVHIFSSSVDDDCFLDIIARMKIFHCQLGAVTFLDEKQNLTLATIEMNETLDNIWNLCLKILIDVAQKPVIRWMSDEMKELKQTLKRENISNMLKVTTLFPINETDVEMEIKFEPNSVYGSPL